MNIREAIQVIRSHYSMWGDFANRSAFITEVGILFNLQIGPETVNISLTKDELNITRFVDDHHTRDGLEAYIPITDQTNCLAFISKFASNNLGSETYSNVVFKWHASSHALVLRVPGEPVTITLTDAGIITETTKYESDHPGNYQTVTNFHAA